MKSISYLLNLELESIIIQMKFLKVAGEVDLIFDTFFRAELSLPLIHCLIKYDRNIVVELLSTKVRKIHRCLIQGIAKKGVQVCTQASSDKLEASTLHGHHQWGHTCIAGQVKVHVVDCHEMLKCGQVACSTRKMNGVSTVVVCAMDVWSEGEDFLDVRSTANARDYHKRCDISRHDWLVNRPKVLTYFDDRLNLFRFYSCIDDGFGTLRLRASLVCHVMFLYFHYFLLYYVIY